MMARPHAIKPTKPTHRRPEGVDLSLRVAGAEITALLLLLGFYLAVGDLLGSDWFDTANFWGPLGLIGILSAAAMRMLRRNPSSLWSALFWFRVATSIYFGFGQMAPFLMNGTSLLYFGHYFNPSPADLLKLNVIVTVGVLCIIVAAQITGAVMGPAPLRSADEAQRDGRTAAKRRLGLLLLLIGGGVKYAIVFPQAMGWTTDVLPGAVTLLGSLSMAAIYLLTDWSLSARNGAGFFAITVFVALEMLSGLVLMIRGEVLLPLLVYLMAIITHKASLTRLTLTVVSVVLLFSVLVPLVSHGRDMMGKLAVERGQIGIEQRIELLSSYYDDTSAYAAPQELQGGYLRISYASMGGSLVSRYDAGLPGNSLEHMLAILIPRMLWPEKPIINLGQQMSIIITGNENNAVGAGLFFESYWNLGWAGLPLLLMPFGAILYLLSRYANYILRERQFIFMPVLFTAMRVGLAIDNHYVGQIGSIVQIIGLHFLIVAAMRLATLLGSRSMPRTAR